MTYERFLEISQQYDEQLNIWSDALNVFPKLPDGRITDEARKTDAFKTARKMYDLYFQLYRKLNKDNKQYVKRRHQEKRAALPVK